MRRLVTITVWLCLLPLFCVAQCDRERDSLALVDLYTSTHENGPWTNEWDLNQSIDTWFGIELNDSGCVSKIELCTNCSDYLAGGEGNNLQGTLPSSIGSLSELNTLSISRNRLNGEIPLEIGNLLKLDTLQLNSNLLTGTIPSELGELGELIVLSISGNRLEGQIPVEIVKISNLKTLYIYNNNITGSLPSEIGLLSRLRNFHAFQNSINGVIPESFTNLTELSSLNLCCNNFTDPLPSLFGNLSMLNTLILADNGFESPLPESLSSLSRLSQLNLSNNNFSEPIPESILQMEILRILNLSSNKFSGEIFSRLSELTRLRLVDLSNNQLEGCFAEELRTLCALESITDTNQFGYNFANNIELPWEGDFSKFCAGEDQTETQCVTSSSTQMRPFITKWKTDNPGFTCDSCIEIPTTGEGYSYDVDWENDGVFDEFGITGDAFHQYDAPGEYEVAIQGDFPRIYFSELEQETDHEKIIDILQWGDIQWSSMDFAFFNCDSLIMSALDIPDLSDVNSLQSMFQGCIIFNGDLSNWNVSNVTDMSSMFRGASSFNQDLNNWDVSSVKDMSSMFSVSPFNGDISEWDVSNVMNMFGMFTDAKNFDRDLSQWDVSNVINMKSMFIGCDNFKSDLANWNVSNVTDMSGMFALTDNFNGNISDWDVSNVKTMGGMFNKAILFNRSLERWNLFKIEISEDEFTLNFMLENSGMSQKTYEATLLGWAQNPNTPDNLDLGALNIEYCDEEGRDILIIEKGWTIEGDIKLNTGDSCDDGDPNTDNEQIQEDCSCGTACASNSNQVLTICEGEFINIGESNFTQSGQFSVALTSEQGCDSIINLDLTVIPRRNIFILIADQFLCPNETDFHSIELDDSLYSFSWESATAEFTDPDKNMTEIINLASGQNIIQYTYTTLDDCSFVYSIDFTIFVDDLPVLQEDLIEAIYGQPVSISDPLINDDLSAISDDYTIKVDQASLPGDLESTGQNQWNWIPAPGCLGEFRLPYTVCNEACTDLCSTSEIIINITPAAGDAAALIPTGISPNGDGVNDSFVIPILKSFPQNYQNNQLRIINRWGQTLYNAQPYTNDWEGTDRSGSPIVQGTYYYHWDPGNGEEVVTGRVSILR